MKIKKDFYNIFSIILPGYNICILLNKLQKLYDNKIFTKEIILNIIKFLIFILNNNQNKLNIYINLLDYFLINKNYKLSIFLQNLNLSYQFKLNEKTINKIMIYIDYVIINNNQYDKTIEDLIFIINKLKILKLSFDIKLILFIHLVSNIDTNIQIYTNELYNIIIKFINS
jgi:hypothetical protein